MGLNGLGDNAISGVVPNQNPVGVPSGTGAVRIFQSPCIVIVPILVQTWIACAAARDKQIICIERIRRSSLVIAERIAL